HFFAQVLPHTPYSSHYAHSLHDALPIDVARDSCHLVGEGAQLIDHRVDRVLQLEDLTLDVHGDLLRQVAFRDRGRHLGDVADLAGQVAGQLVHVVGQVLPRSRDALDLCLAAEAPVGSHVAHTSGHHAQSG